LRVGDLINGFSMVGNKRYCRFAYTAMAVLATAIWRLARLRGFALENADFTVFCLLIGKETGLQFSPKTAVVRTYPIPKRGLVRTDSLHHVPAANRAKEERQDAQLANLLSHWPLGSVGALVEHSG